MKLWKKIAIALAVVVVVLQFIRPEKNAGNSPTMHSITQNFPVPAGVQTVLQRSCYNCHSNRTDYPWYEEVQPVGWFLNKHIQDGKRGLNFDEYTTYRIMKQYRRFNDIIENVDKDEMPLPSYLIIHRNAKLTASEKDELIRWCNAMRDSMKVKFPVDSLERKRQR